jgi:hypothetical protein
MTLALLPEADQSIFTVSPGQMVLGATLKVFIWAQPARNGTASSAANMSGRSGRLDAVFAGLIPGIAEAGCFR